MMIPKQLQQNQFRFCLLNKWCKWKETKNNYVEEISKINLNKYIRLKKGGIYKELGKAPIEQKWTTENNYEYNNEKLINHFKNGNNIGVVVGYGNLRVLDIDNIELTENLDKKINTFTVKTGSGGRHYYFISKYNKNHVLENGAGEFRANNYQVVAPNSTHPSGNKYVVINDIEIKTLTEKEIEEILKLFTSKQKKNEISEQIELKNKEFINNYIFPTLPPETIKLISKKLDKNKLLESGFPSRSERDQRVIVQLLLKGWGRYIKSIFTLYPIGDKYKEQGDAYLLYSIKSARKYSGVEEDDFLMLEREINNAGILLKTKLDYYLNKITNVSEWVKQNNLISQIAYKIKSSKYDLLKRFKEIQNKKDRKPAAPIIDLLNKEEIKFEYWAEPIVPKDSLILIGGKPGSFKSLFTLLISLHLKNKKPFLDKYEIKDIPKILLYDIENSDKTLIDRVKYILKDEKNVDCLKTGFHFKKNFDIYDIKSEVEEAKNFDVIILDSYVRFLKDSENKSEVVNEFYKDFIKPLRDLKKTVIIIHHLKKTKVEDIDVDDLQQLFRGSSDITAQFDLVYNLFKTPVVLINNNISFDVSVILAKNRNGIPISNFTFKVVKDDANKKTNIYYLSEKVAITKKDKIQNTVLNLLKEKEEVSLNEIVENVKKAVSVSDIFIYKIISEMKKYMMIIQKKRGYYSLPEALDKKRDIKVNLI